MLRRLLAFTLVAIVLGSPLATAVCQAMCADHDAHAANQARGSQHACHEELTASGLMMAAVPHACGHDDALLRAVDQSSGPSTQVAVMPVASFVAPVVGTTASCPFAIQPSPHGFAPLTTQLRL